VELRVGALQDFRRYLKLLRRWWWLLVLAPLVGAGIGLVVGLWTPRVYQAATYLVINQIANPYAPNPNIDLGLSQGAAVQYGQLMRTDPFMAEVIQQLGLPLTLKEMNEKIIAVRVLSGSQYLLLVVQDTDPARAALIANKMPEILLRRVQEQRARDVQPVRAEIERELDDARQRVTEASNRLTQIRATPSVGGDTLLEEQRLQTDLALYQSVYFGLLGEQRRMRFEQLHIASAISVAIPAEVPVEPVPRTVAPQMQRFGLIGLLLALGFVVAKDLLDDRFRSLRTLRRRYDLAPLGVLPAIGAGEGAPMAAPALLQDDRLIEPLRLLRTRLGFVNPGMPTAICVSGARRGEGASTVAAHLAIAEAQAGKHVILIDADLREPALHRFFDLDNEHGLSTWLARSPGSPLQLPLQDGPPGLRILTGGPVLANATELLSSPRLGELLDDLRSQADIVILDAAPLLPFADTLALQRLVDGAVLVVDAGRTGTRLLERALGALQQTSGNVLGVVLNKDTEQIDANGYGYERYSEQRDGGEPSEAASVRTASRAYVNGADARESLVTDLDERMIRRR